MQKSFIEKFRFWARNLHSKEIFKALDQFCKGAVLDVGGRDFYLLATQKNFIFETWTVLEKNAEAMLTLEEEGFECIQGDGCAMPFEDNNFDTVLNIQVLEHVIHPHKMIQEIHRVLNPGGYAIFLIPQTSVLHELPHHYYNFTRFWIEASMKESHLEIVEIKPLGGFWSSMASHLLHFIFQSFRAKGMSLPIFKRSIIFYFLFPFMLLYVLLGIPICLFFGLGDLAEEPNNHLVVVKKL